MELFKKLREKRDTIRFVDQYMHQIEEESFTDSTIEVTHTNNIYHFKENYRDETFEYDIPLKMLYSVCEEARDMESVRGLIDKFLIQCAYKQYIELGDKEK